ncbi:MAG: CPBP family intramembrane glutamic endopeptidase [Bacteriovoracaceae bacterium]
MKLQKNIFIVLAFVALYFGVAWFFPWELAQLDSTVSIAYLWDVLFAVLIGIAYQLPLKKPTWPKHFKGALARCLVILLLALTSIMFLKMASIATPFRYLERPILQLLILAPLLEELVFRHAFLGALLRALNSETKALLISSFLFSVSHLPGIWHLPEEFRPFIVIQLVYAFAMGWVIGKARTRTGAVWEPIFLHFLFNLCFYFAVLRGWV